MKETLKAISYFFISIKVCYLKLKSHFAGDYILNSYIEKCSPRFIVFVLNKLGASVNISANVREGMVLDNTYFNYSNLNIGQNCYVGKNVFFDMVSSIEIKRDAVVSEGVTILTHQDVGDRMLCSFYKRRVAPVVLDEGCWIGANSTILCGIRVGKCAVVAAGSVVTKDVPDYTVVGGVPAIVKKSLK